MQNFLKIREKEFHKNRNESFSCINGSEKNWNINKTNN